MVTATSCGFCETCFILASIASLVHGRTLQNEKAQKTDISSDVYDVTSTTVILENKDANSKLYEYEATEEKKPEKPSSAEGWCVVWYLGAFGSLVCFFLVITCMELFFRMPHYRHNNLAAFVQNVVSNENKTYVPETPPPPYHLFAPPDYYETIQKCATDERKTLEIFVIPVYQKPVGGVQQV